MSVSQTRVRFICRILGDGYEIEVKWDGIASFRIVQSVAAPDANCVLWVIG